jgi:hypothetical protein
LPDTAHRVRSTMLAICVPAEYFDHTGPSLCHLVVAAALRSAQRAALCLGASSSRTIRVHVVGAMKTAAAKCRPPDLEIGCSDCFPTYSKAPPNTYPLCEGRQASGHFGS